MLKFSAHFSQDNSEIESIEASMNQLIERKRRTGTVKEDTIFNIKVDLFKEPDLFRDL